MVSLTSSSALWRCYDVLTMPIPVREKIIIGVVDTSRCSWRMGEWGVRWEWDVCVTAKTSNNRGIALTKSGLDENKKSCQVYHKIRMGLCCYPKCSLPTWWRSGVACCTAIYVVIKLLLHVVTERWLATSQGQVLFWKAVSGKTVRQ